MPVIIFYQINILSAWISRGEESEENMSKLMTAQEAIALIKDGDGVAISGFHEIVVARELYKELAKTYRETGHPRDLTLVQASGNRGIFEMTEEGLFAHYIAGHYTYNQKMIDMINDNKIKSHNLPQGVISHMYRAAAGGKIGELTKIGLHTFCDPRYGGGKMNDITTEDIVELLVIDGQEQLLYKLPKMDIGIIRGTTADEFGNITIEEECLPADILDVAMAVKSMGGKVIAQVKNYVPAEKMHRTEVVVPGSMVDAIVICSDPETNHRQTPVFEYSPELAGHGRLEIGFDVLPMNERKIIARRAAMELSPRSVVNLGIGIPEGVALVANEEGVGDELTLTIESGLIGGIPAGGENFGSSYNAWAALPMSAQFDYYNGGNLNISCLGFAEVDGVGNVNVSRFGTKIAGVGGFIDITQASPVIVFAGTMTAGGLKVEISDGKLNILQEGKKIKFLPQIGQLTFSAEQSRKNGQRILFVTERCVFEVTEQGLVLTEIAPGITLEEHILPCMGFEPIISPELKLMDERIFRDGLMGLDEILKK